MELAWDPDQKSKLVETIPRLPRRYAMYCVIRLVPTAAMIVISFTFTLGAKLAILMKIEGTSVDVWAGINEIFVLESLQNPSQEQSGRLLKAASEARHISIILTTLYMAALTLG